MLRLAELPERRLAGRGDKVPLLRASAQWLTFDRGQPMAMMSGTVLDWDDQGWRDQAACRDVDADLFFPAGNTGAAVGHIKAAKAVCRRCPVQAACLRFALETHQEAGVWGGQDEDERRKLRRRQRPGQ